MFQCFRNSVNFFFQRNCYYLILVKKYSMETRVITVLQGQNWGTQQNSEGGAADLAAEEAQVCVLCLRSDLSVNI